MEIKKKLKASSWLYVLTTYIVFAVMVLGICGSASMIFHASPITMRILSNICAWSPTMILFLLFHKWCPDLTVKGFFKRAFAGKLKISLVVMSILSTGFIFIVAAFVYAKIKQAPFSNLFQLGGYSLGTSILLSILSGPTGEECGWRGYLRYEFQTRYGFIKGNFIVGLVWTFWHSVLWMVDSDYTSGGAVIIYIISNIVVITAIHMIMAVILEKQDNLLYAVLIHLFFNLPYCFLNADISFYVIIMILYAIEAASFLGYRQSKIKHNHMSYEA